MRQALIVLAILAALLTSGCCSGCGGFDVDTRRTIFADDLDQPSNNSSAYGIWSTTNTSVLDPAIYRALGYDDASGQWYMLKEDGTFKYVRISPAGDASGGLLRTGRLDVDGGRIRLTAACESYYPDENSTRPSYLQRPAPDESLEYALVDNETLIIRDGTGNGTYYRLD